MFLSVAGALVGECGPGLHAKGELKVGLHEEFEREEMLNEIKFHLFNHCIFVYLT